MYVEQDGQGGLNIMGISPDTAGSLIEAICMHINEYRRQGITPDPELVRMKIEVERESQFKKVKVFPRSGAASVVSHLRILEPAILGLDDRISIAAFDRNYVSVWLPIDRAADLIKKIQSLLDTHV